MGFIHIFNRNQPLVSAAFDKRIVPQCAAGGDCSGAPVPHCEQPFLYLVASELHRVLHLRRETHVAIWNRVLGLYASAGHELPELLKALCQRSFVEDLLENELFWGMVDGGYSRAAYANAPDYLPAVYSTAALLAARQDRLPLEPEDERLLAETTDDADH
jgi:hypothetical protein